jgi:hypothetical protein
LDCQEGRTQETELPQDVSTGENLSDEILTQRGLSTEVIERELRFAFSTCGLRRLGSQGSGDSEDIHRVFSESVSLL